MGEYFDKAERDGPVTTYLDLEAVIPAGCCLCGLYALGQVYSSC